eukprot:946637-Prymnesium_polylepis.1
MASTNTGRPVSHVACTSGARAGVTVRTMLAVAHASCALEQTSTDQPSARISVAKAFACSGRRVQVVTRRQDVTEARRRNCHRAWMPQPMTAIVVAAGARWRAARAPAAAVRSSVRRPPSHRIATGANVCCEKTSIRPLFCPPPPEATLDTK